MNLPLLRIKKLYEYCSKRQNVKHYSINTFTLKEINTYILNEFCLTYI